MDIPEEVLEPDHLELPSQGSAELIGIPVGKHIDDIPFLQLVLLVNEILVNPVGIQLAPDGTPAPLHIDLLSSRIDDHRAHGGADGDLIGSHIHFRHNNIHAVVGTAGFHILVQGFPDLLIQGGQHLGRFCDSRSQADILYQGRAYHGHESPGYPMTRGVGTNHHKPVFVHLLIPVEVPRNNIPGLVKHETSRKGIVQFLYGRQYTGLDPLRIVQGIGNVPVLYFDLLFLLNHLTGPFIQLTLQVFLYGLLVTFADLEDRKDDGQYQDHQTNNEPPRLPDGNLHRDIQHQRFCGTVAIPVAGPQHKGIITVFHTAVKGVRQAGSL